MAFLPDVSLGDGPCYVRFSESPNQHCAVARRHTHLIRARSTPLRPARVFPVSRSRSSNSWNIRASIKRFYSGEIAGLTWGYHRISTGGWQSSKYRTYCYHYIILKLLPWHACCVILITTVLFKPPRNAKENTLIDFFYQSEARCTTRYLLDYSHARP